jgi:6-phosphogluconate dehydrogenase
MSTDTPMQVGMVGLGRMRVDPVRRSMDDGHRCVVNDVNAEGVQGATGATPLGDKVLSGLRSEFGGDAGRK